MCLWHLHTFFDNNTNSTSNSYSHLLRLSLSLSVSIPTHTHPSTWYRRAVCDGMWVDVNKHDSHTMVTSYVLCSTHTNHSQRTHLNWKCAAHTHTHPWQHSLTHSLVPNGTTYSVMEATHTQTWHMIIYYFLSSFVSLALFRFVRWVSASAFQSSVEFQRKMVSCVVLSTPFTTKY